MQKKRPPVREADPLRVVVFLAEAVQKKFYCKGDQVAGGGANGCQNHGFQYFGTFELDEQYERHAACRAYALGSVEEHHGCCPVFTAV